MSDIHAHKILILDFGSQYTQLIARRYVKSAYSLKSAPSISPKKRFANTTLTASSWPVARNPSPSWIPPAPHSACLKWACRYLVSATACKPWPSS